MKICSASILLLGATLAPQTASFQISPANPVRSKIGTHFKKSSLIPRSATGQDEEVVTDEKVSASAQAPKSLTERMMAKAPSEGQ
jgi:hypothetical protein